MLRLSFRSGASPRAASILAPILAVSVLLAASTGFTAQTEETDGVFFPETFTLDNGLQVVVVNNSRMPVVTHMVWYKVGAADEPTGKSGIAHFLEHLMFKGTDELAPGEFSRTVARNGGQDNAFTSWDYTAYYQEVAADRLELVMKMEADRMADLQLTDDVVAPERDVVLEERRQRVENEPSDRLSEEAYALLFVHHPYGTPIIGWESEIRDLTTEDARAFYRNWYAPNNAVLVVSGDVTAETLRPLAEKYYGAVPARPVPDRIRVKEPPFDGERRVVLRDAEVRQPSLRRLYKAPSYEAGETRHAYPLQVLSEILGGGSTSRLYRSLVVDQRLATWAGLGYSPSALDLSVLSVFVSPASGVDMSEITRALDAEIARILDEGVSAEEVETAKKRLRHAAVYARDSLSGPARTFGVALTTGQTVEDVEQWPTRIAAVTVDEVNAAARAVLGRKDFVTALLLPPEDGMPPTSTPAPLPAMPEAEVN